MKRIFIIVILVNLFGVIPKAFSEVTWEDCTEGLEGSYITDIINIDNELELFSGSLPFLYSSTDSGKTWIPRKYLLAPTFKETYYSISSIYKYKNRYLMSGSSGIFRVDYISEDKKKLYGTKTYGGPQSAVFMNGFACDSSIIFRFYDSTSKKMRTYITQDEPQGNEGNFNIVPIPEENDFTDSSYKWTDFVQNEGMITATIYRIEKSPYKRIQSERYYYSTDWGWSWKEVKAPEVFAGVKEVQYINGKYYILSPITIWRQGDKDEYVQCYNWENGKFDYLESNFLVEYKGKLITSAMQSGTHKYVLASSTDEGKTWERFGTSDFLITELFVIGDRLLANSKIFGLMISTDDGQTWSESNKGMFPPNSTIYYQQFLKIAVNGNYTYTVPRNYYLRNTIMKSYDGGRSWVRKLVDTSLGYPQDPGSPTDNKYTVAMTKWGLYAMNRGNNTTYRSYDNGETWQFYSNGSIFHDVRNIYERNDTMFYFYPDPPYWIFYSLDTGRTQLIYDATYRQRLPDRNGHLLVVDGVYYVRDSQNKLYKSTDEGNNWKLIESFKMPNNEPTNKIYWAIPSVGKLKIFVTSQKGGHVTKEDSLFITDNFGEKWKKISYPIDSVTPGQWIEINGNFYVLYNFYRGFYIYEGYIYHTSDDGETWEEIAFAPERKNIEILLQGGDYLYANTIEGLYRIYSPPVSVKESKTEEVILPIELYPSPARDIIYVKNDYWGINEVKVYDMLGRECAVGRFNINQFDISNLQPGVYLAKFIFPGNWSIIKKFVKM
ncbi:MAG TPA: T9SS type A sorting domain-containing protein [Candidatus Kapabacteria bacterium]|jgi:hypothetical protein|nr:T9SS type A sorting domain-containing protein [Candidatus Kapabacteria bacterium]